VIEHVAASRPALLGPTVIVIPGQRTAAVEREVPRPAR
jgi:hypothetical protein